MCSSAYWRRTSCAGTGRAHRAAAVRATGSKHRLLIITNLAPALLLAASTGPARGQAAARLAPYRDSIPATLVSFEMVPVPGGSVTLDSPAGPRVVPVAPFWIGKTEVTWDEYDVWVYRLDVVAGAPGGGDSADVTARPSRPYGAPDRGFGHHGYPALAMTYTAAQGYCAWLSARTGRHYGLPTDAQWTRALEAGLGADTSLSAERRDALAWYAGNAANQTHAVATKHADALGVYDLRGTGAVKDCLTSSENIELVALGDLFPDHLAKCRESLATMATEDPTLKPKIKVKDSQCFVGFDAYRKVLEDNADLVLLATPPAFRARHLAAAIDAGKHVFMEKPVAVDPQGVRAVMASAELAAQKGLAIVAGTQRRHDAGYRAAMERIHDGAIGDLVAAEVYWNQGGLWMKPREPSWSDAEWQIRNWLYFTWLSGDHIVEQHIHNIDVANWAFGTHPVKAIAVGGRQRRTDPAYGHIFDHFAVEYQFPNGACLLSMCRQQDGTASRVGERFIGTRGTSDGHAVSE